MLVAHSSTQSRSWLPTAATIFLIGGIAFWHAPIFLKPVYSYRHCMFLKSAVQLDIQIVADFTCGIDNMAIDHVKS